MQLTFPSNPNIPVSTVGSGIPKMVKKSSSFQRAANIQESQGSRQLRITGALPRSQGKWVRKVVNRGNAILLHKALMPPHLQVSLFSPASLLGTGRGCQCVVTSRWPGSWLLNYKSSLTTQQDQLVEMYPLVGREIWVRLCFIWRNATLHYQLLTPYCRLLNQGVSLIGNTSQFTFYQLGKLSLTIFFGKVQSSYLYQGDSSCSLKSNPRSIFFACVLEIDHQDRYHGGNFKHSINDAITVRAQAFRASSRSKPSKRFVKPWRKNK